LVIEAGRARELYASPMNKASRAGYGRPGRGKRAFERPPVLRWRSATSACCWCSATRSEQAR